MAPKVQISEGNRMEVVRLDQPQVSPTFAGNADVSKPRWIIGNRPPSPSGLRRARFAPRNVEARVGIEPTHRGFAALGLTTWLPRRTTRTGKLGDLAASRKF